VLLADLAATSLAVAATPKRTEKLALLADTLRRAGPDEVAVVSSYLTGELRQRRTGVGWKSLQGLPVPAVEPTLTVLEVDAAFAALAGLSGSGSAAARADRLAELWSRATAGEQRLLAGLVSGELRQGASAGLLTDAVARAAGTRTPSSFQSNNHRQRHPRQQVHRDGAEVRVLSRTLDDLTTRMPELVASALALPVRTVVLDGEALVVDGEGRPLPFQVTASRAMSVAGAGLTPWWFDVLHLDGRDLLDEPLSVRASVLERLVPETQRAPRMITSSPDDAAAFAAEALAKGHEGVVVKALDAPYEAGRRGGSWLKVKPRHTLDLVVLAVEHGHGRRRGWLSNLHLGARHGDGFVMLGKTFKGLTDELLRWQTERFRELQVDDDGWVVTVRPEQVVEVAFDGVQASSRYPGGVALRFARVLRYRDDKTAAEADTLDDVLRLGTAHA
jgi:DNA ligase-1